MALGNDRVNFRRFASLAHFVSPVHFAKLAHKTEHSLYPILQAKHAAAWRDQRLIFVKRSIFTMFNITRFAPDLTCLAQERKKKQHNPYGQDPYGNVWCAIISAGRHAGAAGFTFPKYQKFTLVSIHLWGCMPRKL